MLFVIYIADKVITPQRVYSCLLVTDPPPVRGSRCSWVAWWWVGAGTRCVGSVADGSATGPDQSGAGRLRLGGDARLRRGGAAAVAVTAPPEPQWRFTRGAAAARHGDAHKEAADASEHPSGGEFSHASTSSSAAMVIKMRRSRVQYTAAARRAAATSNRVH